MIKFRTVSVLGRLPPFPRRGVQRVSLYIIPIACCLRKYFGIGVHVEIIARAARICVIKFENVKNKNGNKMCFFFLFNTNVIVSADFVLNLVIGSRINETYKRPVVCARPR